MAGSDFAPIQICRRALERRAQEVTGSEVIALTSDPASKRGEELSMKKKAEPIATGGGCGSVFQSSRVLQHCGIVREASNACSTR